jgi:polyribonucleotide 5'-hydroxyl-kinase
LIHSLTYELTIPGGYSFFSWTGCEVEILGTPDVIYITNDTSFPFLANINNELEKDRRHSENNNIAGPTVLLLGRNQTGKTSILRTLSHYALRSGWNPTYVDLNINNNNFSIPGTITSTPITCQSKPNALLSFGKTTPLVYFYGHKTINTHEDLFLAECNALGDAVQQRMLSSTMRSTDFPGYITKSDTTNIPPEMILLTKHAGTFIDTPDELAILNENNIILIEKICKLFHVNLILVLDNESLHAKLLSHKPLQTLNAGIAVARIPKFLGVVVQSDEVRLWDQKLKIDHYFRGKKGQYIPLSNTLSLEHISIYSTDKTMSVPLTALPLGREEEFQQQQTLVGIDLDRVVYGDLKQNSILALSYCVDDKGGQNNEQNNIINFPVAGFVHIQAIPNQNDPSRAITKPILYCLFPNRVPPPHLTQFLVGSITWTDS